MSFANNLKAVVPGTIIVLSLAAAGLAYADQTERFDGLGQAIALKQQNSGSANAAVHVKNQTRDQVKSDKAVTGRADDLGLFIAAKNENAVRVNSALAATKNTGSNQSGQ